MTSPEIKFTSSLLRWLYSAVLYLTVPFVVLRLLFKSFSHSGYRDRIQQRFGYIAAVDDARPVLWIHAVSVGEVHATRPLVEQIMRSWPGYYIVISTMTPTGADAVKRLFGSGVRHVYVPYDLPGSVRRFLQRLNPALLVVMETEIWPNLFHECGARSVPVIMVNVRLSEKSFAGYVKAGTLISSALVNIVLLVAQTREDAERFLKLGMDHSRVSVSGSLKFDIDLADEIRVSDPVYSREKTGPRSIWIAASTHAGEETVLLSAHQDILKESPDSLLVIAPRHPERAAEVYDLARRSGLKAVLRSQSREIESDVQVFIVDALGVLPTFYCLADVAFVGGSLVPVGGHNMLEPASLGIPVITGHHVHNFAEITLMLVGSGAAWQVENSQQITSRVLELFRDPAARQAAGAKARDLIKRNRGTCERVMQLLQPLLARHATFTNRGI